MSHPMKFLLLIFFTSVFSCTNQNHITHQELIEFISNEDPDGYSLVSEIYLFSIFKNENKIKLLDSSILLKGHYHFFNDVSYKDFVLGVFSNKCNLECTEVYECFALDEVISADYNQLSFSSFVEKYIIHRSKNNHTIKKDLSHNATLTVMYYLFLNDYFTVYDDISGLYYSERMKSLPTEESIKLEELQ